MKFGLREVCNVVLKARKDGTFLGKEFKQGQPVLWFDSLKTSGLEGSGEIIYARGGRGNTKLVSWTGDREVTFTMEDALISPMSMALLTAGSLRKAGTDDNKIISHRTATATFKKDAKLHMDGKETTVSGFIFSDLPKDENFCDTEPRFLIIDNQCYNLIHDDLFGFTPCDEGYLCELSAQETSEIEEALIKQFEGKNGQIDFYVEKTSKMIQIDISPDSFGAGFYLEGETLFREYGEGGYDQAAEFIVPNCKVQSNFNFSMASTGDPSTFTFTMDAFPAYLDLDSTAGDKVLCAIQVFEEEKNEGGN